MRRQFVIFYIVVQTILALVHLFLYETWKHFWYPANASPSAGVKLAFAILALSFPLATLLSFVSRDLASRLLYAISSTWIGFGSYAFYSAMASWMVAGGAALLGESPSRRLIAGIFLTAAFVATVYGVINAAIPRVRLFHIKLNDLPTNWRGRRIAVVSDLHLGPLRGRGFSARIVDTLNRLAPDAVLIPGDFFDGSTVGLTEMAAPWSELRTTHGAYFVAGNHEQFRDDKPYLEALERAGIRVLRDECLSVAGLQVAGVQFRDTVHPTHYRNVVSQLGIDATRASILLSHSPSRLGIPENAGVSLQVSGHTHGGQFWPYTWITKRIFGPYVYGLNPFGKMLVLTTYGAGTWGPPLRVGTTPEIVLIEFD